MLRRSVQNLAATLTFRPPDRIEFAAPPFGAAVFFWVSGSFDGRSK